MKGVVALALFLVAALLMVGQFLAPEKPLAAGPAAAPSARLTGSSAHFAGDDLVLDRDRSGQFHMDAAVNGNQTKFLVDTGADTVALTVSDAEAAGIPVNPDAFVPMVQTASGQGYGTVVMLDRLEIGDTELRNVGAVVIKDLGVSLLGQSVLARMGRVELKGDRMVIEQRP